MGRALPVVCAFQMWMHDGPSGISVATDLGLDIFSHVSKQENACHLANKCSNHSLNFKTLFKDLLGRVGRQSEALGVVSQIVAQSWLSDGSHQRSNLRGDIWLEFIGPDIIGKRRTALALAEVLFGNKKYFIQVNFGSEYVVVHQKKVFGYQITNSFDAKSRGKTVVDYIAKKLRKTPFSVVLLENVLLADPVAQRSLLQAIRNGKFSDSHGKEISLTKGVFVLTSRLVKDSSIFFPEARIENTRGTTLKLVIKDTGDYETNKNLSKVGPEKDIPNQYLLCKRKLSNTHETIWPHKGSMSSMCMDLNLPAQAIEEDDYIGNADEGYECKDGMSWLDELADEGIDKTLTKVRFDPFDYDAVAASILKWVHVAFGEVTNSKCVLEIEPRAMDQILVAVCLTRADQDVRDWIDGVLRKSFAEALKTYQLTSHTIVMLATCDGDTLHMVDQVFGFCLPSKVSVT